MAASNDKPPSWRSPICVLFDLDGTLVDSELLAIQSLLDLVPDIDEPADSLRRRYRGWQLAATLADIEDRIGKKLPVDFIAQYRTHSSRSFETGLRPIDGAGAMLRALPHAKCIASGGPREKIELSLTLCDLAHHFGSNVFSSYDIQAWKPDPGLFLHAAGTMGFHIDDCIVIEDSDVGVEAAKAARIRVLRYVPVGEVVNDFSVPHFTDLLRLPDLLRGMTMRPGFASALR